MLSKEDVYKHMYIYLTRSKVNCNEHGGDSEKITINIRERERKTSLFFII